MSIRTARPGDDTPIEIIGGRQPAPYSKAPIWLMFVASPKARALYDVLAAHVNPVGDPLVWPTREILAELMDLKQARAVDPYLRELEKAGAIDIIHRRSANGMNDKNVYVIHHEPPDGYEGPRSMADFYRLRKAVVPGGDVVRSSALPAELGNPTTTETENRTIGGENCVCAGRPVVRSSAPRSALQRTVVVRSSAPEVEQVEVEQEPLLPQPPHEPSRVTHVSPREEEGETTEATPPSRRAATAGREHDGERGVSQTPGSAGPVDGAAALEWVGALPWTHTPGRRKRERLAVLVAAAWAAGWSGEALRRHLTAELGGAQSLYAVWLRRLEDLPEPPRAAPPRPSAGDGPRPGQGSRCGRCNPYWRLEDADGNDAGPCPECYGTLQPAGGVR